jgi:hypothetical protein
MGDQIRERRGETDMSKQTLAVGTRVFLKLPMLGNPTGAMGYVVETYPDFDKLGIGATIIFANGQYCGFDVRDQATLVVGEIDEEYANYEFTTANKLRTDYSAKYWDFTNYGKVDTETA